MRAALIALLVLATTLAQVVVAPLFPLQGMVVELPVVALLLLAVFAGPRAVMITLPLLVIAIGFSTNVEFEWLVLAYLPLLPCAAWIQRQALIPQTPYLLVLGMAFASGLWVRAVFSGVAMLSGASLSVDAIVFDALLPGALFDAVVASIAYALCRWIGWTTRSLDLERAVF